MEIDKKTAEELNKSLPTRQEWEREEQKRITILQNPELLINVVNEVQKEVAGEEDTIIAETIVASTRLVKEAIPEAKNLFLSDKTGLGKDFVTKKTLQVVVPSDRLLHVTKMSNESFTYWHNPKYEPEWTWNDKVIHFEDINQSLLNGSTFKVMSSGGSRAVVVIKQRTIEIPINGKPVMFLTSHHANPNDENLRRYPIAGLNSTEIQTQRIKDKIARKYTGEHKIQPDNDLRHALHTLLSYQVIIPFAELIQNFFPSDTIMRTHFQRFLNYICASAVFHQVQRERKDGFLIATPDDYMVARLVLIYTTSNPKMIPLSKEYRDIIELLQIANKELTINEIFLLPEFNHSKTWLYRNLPKLCSTGIIGKSQRYDDNSHKNVDTYFFADLNARALLTWNELIDKLKNSENTVNTVKTKNTSTEGNHNDIWFSQGVLKHVKTGVLKPPNGKVFTVFTVLTSFLRKRDNKRFSKYYEEYDESTNNNPSIEEITALDDKLIDTKKIIEKNPEDNYPLIEEKYGQPFIDKLMEQGIVSEKFLGKQLQWIWTK